jgi:hypothetical protein
MAQDPEGEQGTQSSGNVNLSHEKDMALLFESKATDAEVNADNIQGVLKSNGIESVVDRAWPYPILGVRVYVAHDDLEQAQFLISEALEAGPDAAADAEAQSELPT